MNAIKSFDLQFTDRSGYAVNDYILEKKRIDKQNFGNEFFNSQCISDDGKYQCILTVKDTTRQSQEFVKIREMLQNITNKVKNEQHSMGSQHEEIDEKGDDRPLVHIFEDFKLITTVMTSNLDSLKEDFDISRARYQFSLINGYLVASTEKHIIYQKVFPYEKESSSSQKANFSVVKFILDSNIRIIGFKSTLEPDIIQIIFQSLDKIITILTWDLIANCEKMLFSSALQNFIQSQNLRSLIVRGIDTNYNCIMMADMIYDLKTNLPCFFYDQNTKNQILNDRYQNYAPSFKLPSHKNFLIGINNSSSYFNTHSFLDIIYWKNVHLKHLAHQLQYKDIQTCKIMKNFNGVNLFQQYALSSTILEKISQQLLEGAQQELNEQICLLVVQKSSQDMATAIEICIKNSNLQSTELMLRLLIHSSTQQFTFKYIQKHFQYLIKTHPLIFKKYLSQRVFKFINMNEDQYIQWDNEEDQIYTFYENSYVGQDFLLSLSRKNVKLGIYEWLSNKLSRNRRNKTAVQPQQPPQKNIQREYQQIGEFSNEDNLSKNHNQIIEHEENKDLSNKNKKQAKIIKNSLEKRYVQVQILDLENPLSGNFANELIHHLASTDDDSLFAIHTIRILVHALWSKFFYSILLKVFLPFFAYLVIFLVYVTYIYERHVDENSDNKWFIIDVVFLIVYSLLQLFFFGFEIVQFKLQGFRKYFFDVWNILDIFQLSLSTIFIICDSFKVDPAKVRPIGAVAVFLIWVRFFQFLRLFQATASLIRMIIEICKEMASFSLILLIAIVAFGNTFYILAVNGLKESSEDDATMFTGGNFLITLIYSLRIGLGDFGTDGYEVNSEALIWVIFVAEAILIQIILMNLLIAIMGNTFERVTELGDKAMLKERCVLIYEYDFLINRKQLFKGAKNVIVASVVKTENDESTVNEQAVLIQKMRSLLETHSQTVMQAVREMQNEHSAMLKQQMSGVLKACEDNSIALKHLISVQNREVIQKDIQENK